MNYKILHFADLHLDASFAGTGLSGLEARKHREHLREALKRMLDLALKKEVNAVTIAGDLFEQERFSRDTGEFLLSQFRRIAPVKVFIAPGNHVCGGIPLPFSPLACQCDYFSKRGIYAGSLDAGGDALGAGASVAFCSEEAAGEFQSCRDRETYFAVSRFGHVRRAGRKKDPRAFSARRSAQK